MNMNGEGITIGGDSVDIPNGTYPAALFAIIPKTSDAYGEFWAWDFQVRKPDGEVVVVGGASSTNTGSKSKAGKWLAALLGRKLVKGETVNPVGQPCMVVIEEVDGWPKVTEVLPPMVAAAAPAPVAAEQPAKVANIGDLPF